MSAILAEILSKIEVQNPLHAKKLKENQLHSDRKYLERAELFFTEYNTLLSEKGLDLDYAVTCYLKMIAEMLFEQIRFVESGKYSSTSFDEVNAVIYNNPEKIESYMHGLLLSQFLWLHHYKIFTFFADNIESYKNSVKSYLEIGGGHGLYLKEAEKKLLPSCRFDMVDISPTSVEIAKRFIKSDKIHYLIKDIFDFNSSEKYDFISMCEVLEHVEDPLKLLNKLNYLLSPNGTAYITTPTNAPTIDHIYLFNNTDEIRGLIKSAGFIIEDEFETPVEQVSIQEAHKRKICVMYAAFIKHN